MRLITNLYSRRYIALALVLTLVPVAVPSLAADSSVLTGTVVASDSLSPLAGATVHLSDPRTGDLYSSEPTDSQGRYAVQGLPAASYELGVEAEGRLFVAGAPAVMAPGQSHNVNVAVNRQQDPGADPPKKKGSILSNPVTAVLIVAGTATLIAAVLEEDDDAPGAVPSPSAP